MISSNNKDNNSGADHHHYQRRRHTISSGSKITPTATTATMHDYHEQQLIVMKDDYNRFMVLDNSECTEEDADGAMPSLNVQQETASHYKKYLKEFRAEPCPLFKQHQCSNHRPYSCFYWHFANQRRRRPVRRKDGTFNYSADFYCTKYNENTGICPDGDDCPYLHRVYGDVERKYHLRYYKTAPCVHPTDSRGHCSKNGAHCAFAHGSDDIRNPIFDIRELQHCGELNFENIDNRDRLNFIVEDPIWQDQAYVLMNYKTEPCKKPPRLCRQGYACPYYHNGKDKRRLPHKQTTTTAGNNGGGGVITGSNGNQNNGTGTAAVTTVYRSTPCPNVKKGDEWGDPDACEAGDNCPYCHTRTEQQFHPEIYKSTKCNDMLQHGYCPRGPFCAFAHSDVELHGERRHSTSAKRASFSSSSAGGGVGNGEMSIQMKQQAKAASDRVKESRRRVSAVADFASPTLDTPASPAAAAAAFRKNSLDMLTTTACAPPSKAAFGAEQGGGVDGGGNAGGTTSATSEAEKSAPSYSAVLQHRYSNSRSGPDSGEPSPPMITTTSSCAGYSKAPGFEREQHSPPRPWLASLDTSPPGSFGGGVGGYDPSLLDQMYADACKIKTNLYLHHDIGCDLSGGAAAAAMEQGDCGGGGGPTTPPTPASSGYGGRMSPPSFGSSSGGGNNNNGCHLWQQSSSRHRRDSCDGVMITDEMAALPSISERDERKPAGNGDGGGSNLLKCMVSSGQPVVSNQRVAISSADFEDQQQQQHGGVGNGRARSLSLFAPPRSDFEDGICGGGGDVASGVNIGFFMAELRRADEELSSIRCKLAAYEECAKRARQDCETWKREALENKYRAQVADQERMKAEQDRDRVNSQFAIITNEFKSLQMSGYWPLNTDLLSSPQLDQVRARLRAELEKVEHHLQQRANNGGPMCARCGRHVNSDTSSSGTNANAMMPAVCPLCSPNCKSNGQHHHQALAT